MRREKETHKDTRRDSFLIMASVILQKRAKTRFTGFTTPKTTPIYSPTAFTKQIMLNRLLEGNTSKNLKKEKKEKTNLLHLF